jgi:hypothetical protein
MLILLVHTYGTVQSRRRRSRPPDSLMNPTATISRSSRNSAVAVFKPRRLHRPLLRHLPQDRRLQLLHIRRDLPPNPRDSRNHRYRNRTPHQILPLHRRQRRSAQRLPMTTSADPPSFAASRRSRKLTTKTRSRLTRPPPTTLVPVRQNLPKPVLPNSATVRPRLPRRLRVRNGTSIKSLIHLIS